MNDKGYTKKDVFLLEASLVFVNIWICEKNIIYYVYYIYIKICLYTVKKDILSGYSEIYKIIMQGVLI